MAWMDVKGVERIGAVYAPPDVSAEGIDAGVWAWVYAGRVLLIFSPVMRVDGVLRLDGVVRVDRV